MAHKEFPLDPNEYLTESRVIINLDKVTLAEEYANITIVQLEGIGYRIYLDVPYSEFKKNYEYNGS